MHKLKEYLCDELKALEKKVSNGHELSMQEIQYGDTLAHFRKNLIKADVMMGNDEEEEEKYSSRGRMGNSYMMRGKRYSRDGVVADMMDELRDLMHNSPDEQIKKEFQRFIDKLEQM